jgi:hypothetical protein
MISRNAYECPPWVDDETDSHPKKKWLGEFPPSHLKADLHLSRSVVHEQSQKKNYRKRDTDQPKQSASTKAHDGLHNLCCVVNSAVFREFRILRTSLTSFRFEASDRAA